MAPAVEPVKADVGDFTYVALAAGEAKVAVVYRTDRYQSNSIGKEPLSVQDFESPVISELVRRLRDRASDVRIPESDTEHRHYFNMHA